MVFFIFCSNFDRTMRDPRRLVWACNVCLSPTIRIICLYGIILDTLDSENRLMNHLVGNIKYHKFTQ